MPVKNGVTDLLPFWLDTGSHSVVSHVRPTICTINNVYNWNYGMNRLHTCLK